MSGIKVEINMAQLKALQLNLATIDGAGRTVTVRAVNKTLSGVRTDAVDEIYKILNLTKTRIRQDFTIYRATWNWGGKVKASGEPVGLASFGAVKRKKGVSVQVLKKNARKIIEHSFLLTQKRTDQSTYKNVYMRSWKGSRTGGSAYGYYWGDYRYSIKYPLERLTGPRIEDIFGQKEVLAAVEKKADVRLQKNLDHELDYFMSKL